jgi:hypothetical protein
MPMDEDHRGTNHQTGHDEPKGLDLIPEPPKNENVAKPDGNRRQKDDEKGSVHK